MVSSVECYLLRQLQEEVNKRTRVGNNYIFSFLYCGVIHKNVSEYIYIYIYIHKACGSTQ